MDALPTFVAALVILILGWISVALRFYTRIFARQGLKWDDWLLLIAALTGTTIIALTVSGEHNTSSSRSQSTVLPPKEQVRS